MSALGTFLSIAGLGLSIVGFPVALFQLFRTQRAAAAAATAVEEAKESWARYDVRNEISKSLTYARVALEHLANSKFDSAMNGMIEFNLSLSRLSALGHGLSLQDVDSIRNEMAELLSLVDGFESVLETGPDAVLLKRAKSRLRRQLGFLTEIEIRFQDSVR